MTVLQGYISKGSLGSATNQAFSAQLRSFETDYWPSHASDIAPGSGTILTRVFVGTNPRVLSGAVAACYINDYYERIHIRPTEIDLGQISATQSQTFEVWNAYRTQAYNLSSITDENAYGISLTGPDVLPINFPPLYSTSWRATILINGPPDINAEFLFNFDGLANPPVVVIIGSRAIVSSIIPEIPVQETWEWLTDPHVAYDGTEQRIALRNVPRRTLDETLMFESEDECRNAYKILFSAFGRLFVPYFQYTAQTTQAAAVGDTVLVFDTASLDLRDDDYVLLLLTTGFLLIQCDVIGTNSATLKIPLSTAIPAKTIISSIFQSFLPNSLVMQRPALDNTATLKLTSTATYPRSSHQRQGSTAVMSQFDGFYVLERQPLADDDIDYTFDTGQELLDAKLGLTEVDSDWIFPRVDTPFSFRFRRLGINECSGLTGPEEMDYWRLFTDLMKGSQNNFLLSTWRKDQLIFGSVGVGAASFSFIGSSYNDIYWSATPYQYLAIVTDAGTHYAQVTASSKDANGNSAVTFSPALPSDAGWNNVQYVSYLLKMKIANDVVQLQHEAFNTVISFQARTVDE